jgi:hypothetical protein
VNSISGNEGRGPFRIRELVRDFSEPAVSECPSLAVETAAPPAVQQEDIEMEAISERDWVPKDFTDVVDISVNAANKRSLRSNHLTGTLTKYSIVINREGQRFPLFVKKHNRDISLKFAFIDRSDNLTLELCLEAGILPQLSLPDAVTISPKDGYLTAQFPLLPITHDELKVQMDRRVIETTQDGPRAGSLGTRSAPYPFINRKRQFNIQISLEHLIHI